MEDSILPNDYMETVNIIKKKIESAQQRAIISANICMLDLYWEIGNIILAKKEQAGWGAKIIKTLSKDITSNFPGSKGYSQRNLEYMSQFAKTYSDYLSIRELLSKISWSHNIILMSKISNEDERKWYINKSIENGWARNVLIHQIEYGLYDRIVEKEKINNFSNILPSPQSELALQTMKDPYIFDFLTLEEEYKEKDLENQLVKHITDFLLELGSGFAFVGRQYHLEIGNNDYYIDLLFYHLKLKCYVVVELKTVAFQPEFARKIEFLFISS